MSLYLKYRPQTFDDVVGQNYIVEILKSQAQSWDINSNYLFFGPRWTWKTTIARIFARALNCENLQDGNPCNECVSCRLISEGKTMDFVEIDAASHTQVDNIREEIIEKAPYPPTHLKKKVYIIDEVHMLSKAAFNALLKIMEEPPSYLTFILATTEINKVPDTIISRCQVFNFKKHLLEDIINRLKYIAQQENIPYQDNALKLIAQLSDGALRDAVKYLEQVSVLGEVNEENVIKFLWVAPERQIEEFIKLFENLDSNFDKISDFIDSLQQKWVDLSVFIKQILLYIDENFTRNIKFFAFISEIFKNILLSLKLYPNKALAYKLEIAKYINNDNLSFENKVNKNISVETNKSISEDSKEKESSNTQWLNSTENQNNLETNMSSIDYNEVKKQLIENISSTALKTALKRFADIVDIKNWQVELVVINKMQEILLKKTENLKLMEDVLSKILGKPVTLYIKYMSKEQYFEYQMNK